ncbi:MMPL family transporter [Brachybacterium sp. EF45031]|nr:MMPL family transporter [Brachybacterium sillae]
MDALPSTAESVRAQEVADRLPSSDEETLLVVVTRQDGAALTPQDARVLQQLRTELATPGSRPPPPMPSEDGRADLVLASQRADLSDEQADEAVAALRHRVDTVLQGTGLTAQVTGGPAVAADIRGAFAGADFRLLAVTIAVVAVLLLATYRSPVLWLLPLLVVATADAVAGNLADTLGERFSLAFDAGVISVLVFGVGTNYALLLISRYREELRRTEDRREALRRAWAGSVPAILASNLTVVLALLCLGVAVMPATRGLGIASAAGLLVALLAVLGPLTALLAVTGRWVFWPFVPRPGQTRTAAPERTGFGHIAQSVVRRPLLAALASLAVLGVLTSGLLGTRVGLAQDEQFATPSPAQVGFQNIVEHYGAGQSAPHQVAVPTASAEQMVTRLEQVPGIASVTSTGRTADGWSVLSATGTALPESPQATTEVAALRAAARSVDDQALVGGTSARAVDVRADSRRDLVVIAPMVLAVVLVVLVLLLRAVVAPLILLAVNLLSAVAAIGLGLWVGRTVFDIPALDVTVPLLAFLFLVALGVDYTIFLVHRARQESALLGVRQGMVRAVGATGVVITSAGVVLAAVFAALGVLPLVVLGQLGLIVGLGVLLDTLLVRTALVPALFALVGDRMWWPGRAV